MFIKFLQAPTWLQDKTLYFEFPGLYLSKKKKSRGLLGSITCFISAIFQYWIEQKFLRRESEVDNV